MTQPDRRLPLILLVEDALDLYELLSDALAYAGFAVEGASDGAEAVAKARASKPDLILMDISLPIMDGWEATRRLKADPETCHIPVAALTGHTLRRFTERTRLAGCDALIPKPCTPEYLVHEVRRLLAEHGCVAELNGPMA